MRILIALCFTLVILGCGDSPVPKPKAYLRLEYPAPNYERITPALPFSFESNTLAKNISSVRRAQDGRTLGINLQYPDLKGTVYLTYKPIQSNLQLYLLDAQNITQKHTIKADEITEQPFLNAEKRVYGMFYEVGGNAASQSQFYVTDSLNHFVTGSLYFYARPNYDSIYPASEYLKRDIRHIMETIEWLE